MAAGVWQQLINRPLVYDYFQLLGKRGRGDPPLVSVSKISDWNTCLEMLGNVVDSERMISIVSVFCRQTWTSCCGSWRRG